MSKRLTAARRGAKRGQGRKRVAAHRRRTEVAERYEAGQSQQEIARDLGVHQSTVCRDLSALLAEWQDKRVEITDAVKRDQYALLVRELEGLDRDEREHLARKAGLQSQETELIAGWERSKLPARQTTQEQDVQVQDGQGPKPTGRGRAVVKTAERVGDPRFHEVLRGVRAELRACDQAVSDIRLARVRISESIRKLLGADAPTQKALVLPGGEPLPPPAPAVVNKTLVIVAGKDEVPRGLFPAPEPGRG